MKSIFIITLFAWFDMTGQELHTGERTKIYQHLSLFHIDKEEYVINETLSPINKYEIDGNYQRWFYQPFRAGLLVCVNPIKYEKTVFDFLRIKEVSLDTASIYRQIDNSVLDSLSNYNLSLNLISFQKAPLGNSFLGNLFKKKTAVGLSPIYLDKKNEIAFVKLHVYSKKQLANNPSRIIVLQKQGSEWKTLGVIHQTQ
jgi:hypothetical protein